MAKKKQSYLKQKKSFSGSQILLFTVVFAAVGAVAIWQSLAAPHNGGGGGGKPGGGGGTISMKMVTDQNADGLPNYGDTVTFSVSTSASPYPSVVTNCSQNGTVVYTHSGGFYPTYPWPWAQNFTLSSTAWTSGAADCTAQLYYQNNKGSSVYLSSLNFHVNP
jgi:hypothetical protein